MTAKLPALEYRRLRVPAEQGATLIDPPLSSVGELVRANEALRANQNYDFQGKSLHVLAEEARRQLLEKAVKYSSAYRNVSVAAPRHERIFLAGHQPELFHPGVWFKNFTLSRLAERHQAVAVNLLIDNDPLRRASIRCTVRFFGTAERGAR